MVQHQRQSLGADTLIPIRFGNPIPRNGFTIAGRQVAVTRGAIADGTDGLSGRFQFNGPSGVIVKHRADDFQAFFHIVVRAPSGTRSHVRIRGIFIESLCITVLPPTQQDSLGFHPDFFHIHPRRLSVHVIHHCQELTAVFLVQADVVGRDIHLLHPFLTGKTFDLGKQKARITMPPMFRKSIDKPHPRSEFRRLDIIKAGVGAIRYQLVTFGQQQHF